MLPLPKPLNATHQHFGRLIFQSVGPDNGARITVKDRARPRFDLALRKKTGSELSQDITTFRIDPFWQSGYQKRMPLLLLCKTQQRSISSPARCACEVVCRDHFYLSNRIGRREHLHAACSIPSSAFFRSSAQ
jgi:hypothetical protein